MIGRQLGDIVANSTVLIDMHTFAVFARVVAVEVAGPQGVAGPAVGGDV